MTTVIALFLAGYQGIKTINYTEDESASLLMMNVEALSESDTPPANFDCDHGDTPNRYLVCSVENVYVKCETEGQLKYRNETLYGQYKKDTTYPKTIEIFDCSGVDPNSCCPQSKVGAHFLH